MKFPGEQRVRREEGFRPVTRGSAGDEQHRNGRHSRLGGGRTEGSRQGAGGGAAGLRARAPRTLTAVSSKDAAQDLAEGGG